MKCFSLHHRNVLAEVFIRVTRLGEFFWKVLTLEVFCKISEADNIL
jgi:hypothetical protein